MCIAGTDLPAELAAQYEKEASKFETVTLYTQISHLEPQRMHSISLCIIFAFARRASP